MSSRASSGVSTWSFSRVFLIDSAWSHTARISSAGTPPGRLEPPRDVLPALAVDPDADGVLLIDVELQPRPAAGDDLGDVDVLVGGLVQLSGAVDPGRAQ